MTTKLRSVNASKGIPVNYCSGFRSLNVQSAYALDGMQKSLILFVHLKKFQLDDIKLFEIVRYKRYTYLKLLNMFYCRCISRELYHGSKRPRLWLYTN